MEDSQKKGKGASGGRRIDDHSAWMGKGGKESVLPKGVHVKEYSSDGHAAEVMKYEDSSEAIKSQQEMNKSKVKGHPQKPGHRY
jgi:hypothetical protein